MDNTGLVVAYVRACIAGAPDAGDCSPVWQLGVIVVLIVIAIISLVVLRMSAPAAEGRR
jgi:uncharacterized membrane protein YdbT with pleckstrin-like domain